MSFLTIAKLKLPWFLFISFKKLSHEIYLIESLLVKAIAQPYHFQADLYSNLENIFSYEEVDFFVSAL